MKPLPVAKKEKNCARGPPRRTSSGGTAGTTWRSTRSTGWSWRWSRGSGQPSRSRSWSATSSAGRVAGSRNLITSDEYPAYEGAILQAFGTEAVPPRTGKPGRPRSPYKVAPAGLTYATVHKTRKKGRVVEVATRVIFGTAATVEAALARFGGEPHGEHGVRGASQRDGPEPERAEGSEDLSLLEGLAGSSGGELLQRCTVTTSAGRCGR